MALTTADLVEGAPHVEALAGIASATVREKDFELSFDIIDDAGMTVLGITNVVMAVPEPNLEVTWDGTTVTLKGKYSNGWEDIIIHIPKAPEGEPGNATNLNDNDEFEPLSDKHIEPTFTSGYANVPEEQEIVKVKNDTKDFLDVTFDVTAEWEDPLVPGVVTEETVTVTHRVANDWDSAMNWMTEYLERNVG